MKRLPKPDSGFLRLPPPLAKSLGEVLFALAGALAFTATLFLHRTSLPRFTEAAGIYVLVCAAIYLTRFHLRSVPLGGIPTQIAGRMLMLVSLMGVLGVQVLNVALDERALVGSGLLLTVPLLAQAMLSSALLGPAVALFVLTLACLMLGINGAAGLDMLVVSWIGAAVGAHAVNPIKQRNDLLRATSIVAAAQSLIAGCAVAMVSTTWQPVLSSIGWAALGAVLACSFFWMSIAVFERIFGITSDWSLLELCSPEHPLLRELVLRAPGTYAHSVIVGNLAENAAREIGANPVLARAMAYFHDIGKLSRPSHFIENQIDKNPHDDLPPRVSAAVLFGHVQDGLELAHTSRLPKVIRDGIAEHHGTCLVSYFFNRALQIHTEVSPGELERQFRYPGPKPRRKESGILMLADTIEASSRLVSRGQSEELEILISRLVEEKYADGQLSECDLTFRDLSRIKESFLRTLGALRHERISYPDAVLLEEDHVRNTDFDLQQLPKAGDDPETPRHA